MQPPIAPSPASHVCSKRRLTRPWWFHRARYVASVVPVATAAFAAVGADVALAQTAEAGRPTCAGFGRCASGLPRLALELRQHLSIHLTNENERLVALSEHGYQEIAEVAPKRLRKRRYVQMG
jgi:hypothetical protein